MQATGREPVAGRELEVGDVNGDRCFQQVRPKLLCLHADFAGDECLFTDLRARDPLPGVRYAGDVVGRRFIGCGLDLRVQRALERWFAQGRRDRVSGGLDTGAFDRTGRALAQELALQARGRFEVAYRPLAGTLPSEKLVVTEQECSRRSSYPFHWGCYEANITMCFSKPTFGSMQWAILSDSPLAHHVLHLSDVFDPLPDIVVWANGLAESRLPLTVPIGEEGRFSYLTVLPFDDRTDELVVESDTWDEATEQLYPAVRILVRIERRALLAELLRRWDDWLARDYDPQGWNRMDPEDYDEDAIARARPWQPPHLDLVPVRTLIARSANGEKAP